MENKGITRKQFRLQLISPLFNVLLGGYWVHMGLDSGNKWYLITGVLFILFSLGLICSVVIQRRRHPIEDAEVDKEVGEGLKAGGIALLLLAAGFLIGFGLAALFT